MSSSARTIASASNMNGLRSFAAVNRFLADVASPDRRAGYVLLGSEAFLYQQARRGVLEKLVPSDLRDFCLHDLDLSDTSIFEALDLAQTPSLMAPFQVLFIRGTKTLYGRGQKKDEFAAIQSYFDRPNPQALLLFVADDLQLPQDLRQMDMQAKERAEKIRETLGEYCGVVELQSVAADDAIQWARSTAQGAGVEVTEDAGRELIDAVGADMLSVQSQLEKLLLYAGAQGKQTLDVADVEQMVPSAKQRSLYELTDAISRRDVARSLSLLQGLLNASDGGEDSAIGHIFTLAKTFRQLLVLNEKQVRDQRAIWQVLWPGFRVAPYAAEALIAQARRYRDRGDLVLGLRLIAKADLELRSSPADKRLVLERLVMRLASCDSKLSELSAIA